MQVHVELLQRNSAQCFVGGVEPCGVTKQYEGAATLCHWASNTQRHIVPRVHVCTRGGGYLIYSRACAFQCCHIP
jgi:hypothetical protein